MAGFIPYEDLTDEQKHVADVLAANEIQYKIFNKGVQFNVMDLDGIWHSYYPSTGTLLLRKGNGTNITQSFTNITLDKLVKGMKFKHLTQYYFKGE